MVLESIVEIKDSKYLGYMSQSNVQTSLQLSYFFPKPFIDALDILS